MRSRPRHSRPVAFSGPIGRGDDRATSVGETPGSRARNYHVLLVEPAEVLRHALNEVLSSVATVEALGRFEEARKRCHSGPIDFLVTNLRLGAYNGLHLAYLCARAHGTRVIAYSDTWDPGLAREVQRAGAFHELGGACLPATLSAYLTAELPPKDRRDPAVPDRRSLSRSGRRSRDRHLEGLIDVQSVPRSQFATELPG
jgi:DNA-binding NtrC family response regulator